MRSVRAWPGATGRRGQPLATRSVSPAAVPAGGTSFARLVAGIRPSGGALLDGRQKLPSTARRSRFVRCPWVPGSEAAPIERAVVGAGFAGVEERSSRSDDASDELEGPDVPPACKAAGVAGPSREDGSDGRPRTLGLTDPSMKRARS